MTSEYEADCVCKDNPNLSDVCPYVWCAWDRYLWSAEGNYIDGILEAQEDSYIESRLQAKEDREIERQLTDPADWYYDV